MRGLFLKIFAIFWVAQSLIFVISIMLIVRQRFPGPVVSDALDSILLHNAQLAVRAYEANGCIGFSNDPSRYEPSGAALLDQQGQMVCNTSSMASIVTMTLHSPDRVDGRQVDNRYLWYVPATSSAGVRYQYVWLQPASTRPPPRRSSSFMHFAFPQLPVAIAVGGVTTFILALLFSRPLVRLRRAARQLAGGDLSTRVEEPSAKTAGVHSDEFKGLVHDFNHMAERLESMVGAHKLLLRDVSHELRSPLSRLSVALELAREDAGTELDEHLDRIERETQKLNQLIGQLLTLSSLEARESTSSFEPISLNRICEEILPDAEYEAKQRPCHVVLEQSEECVVRGDRELLHRAIENVVRNAIRYTAADSQVTIRVYGEQTNGAQYATVEVNDCGPGVPEAELNDIFRPFYRVDRARSFTTGGFGVGLAITERAVRLHGGTLHATNQLNGGISMKMTFPRQ
jgi:two-component system, OmpR family, sensor histidine kinase CpxA